MRFGDADSYIHIVYYMQIIDKVLAWRYSPSAFRENAQEATRWQNLSLIIELLVLELNRSNVEWVPKQA